MYVLYVCVFVSVCDLPGLQIHEQVKEVFDHPDVIMTKYVQTVMEKVIQVRETACLCCSCDIHSTLL